jgi:hypothetical protein
LAAQANLPQIPTPPPCAPPAPYLRPKEVQVRIINKQLDKLYDNKHDLQDRINKFKQDKNNVLGRVAMPTKATPAMNEGRKSDPLSFAGRVMEGVHNTGCLYTSRQLNQNRSHPDIYIHPDEYACRHERWQEGFETDLRNWGRRDDCWFWPTSQERAYEESHYNKEANIRAWSSIVEEQNDRRDDGSNEIVLEMYNAIYRLVEENCEIRGQKKFSCQRKQNKKKHYSKNAKYQVPREGKPDWLRTDNADLKLRNEEEYNAWLEGRDSEELGTDEEIKVQLENKKCKASHTLDHPVWKNHGFCYLAIIKPRALPVGMWPRNPTIKRIVDMPKYFRKDVTFDLVAVRPNHFHIEIDEVPSTKK